MTKCEHLQAGGGSAGNGHPTPNGDGAWTEGLFAPLSWTFVVLFKIHVPTGEIGGRERCLNLNPGTDGRLAAQYRRECPRHRTGAVAMKGRPDPVCALDAVTRWAAGEISVG